MKKLISLLLAIALVMAISSMAYAVDIPAGKITIAVQPVDYRDAQQGVAQPVSKAYVANERFAVLVSIEVPSWLDTTAMTLEIAPKNCVIDDVATLSLATGDYLLTGTVLAAGATIRITAQDNAIDEANTAAEVYAALYGDRSVSATATLGAAVSSTATQTVSIPKTGAPMSIGGAALCLMLAAGLAGWNKVGKLRLRPRVKRSRHA